jgi:SecD/SecF fusion protein
VVALCIYALYLLALIKLIPVTLTLPGIAGLILTIGVAADANIVIFERVKEEIRHGRSVSAGIAQGYKKGFATIVDANIVTLLVAFILFILATAGRQGLRVRARHRHDGLAVHGGAGDAGDPADDARVALLRRPSALGAGKKRKAITFDFMGASRWFFSMSGVILLVCALAIAAKGLNFGIDFESGTRITAALERPATSTRSAGVAPAGFGDAKIQTIRNEELGPERRADRRRGLRPHAAGHRGAARRVRRPRRSRGLRDRPDRSGAPSRTRRSTRSSRR